MPSIRAPQANTSAVLVATALQTIGAVVATSLAVFAPVLLIELGLDIGELGLLVAAMNVGALPALVLGPTLVDRFGPSHTLAGSGLVSAGGLLLFATGPAYPLMLLALTIVGGSWGISALAGGGAIVGTAPFERRGLLIGFRQMGLPLGGVIAGLLAPLVPIVGWQVIFAGQAVAFVVLSAFALRWQWAVRERTSSPWRSEPPIRAIQLGVLSVAMTTAQWAFIVYLTIELTTRLAVPFELAAGIFLASQVVGALARPALGALADRLGTPRTPLLAAISVASATLILLFGLATAGLPTALIALLAIGAAVFVIGWNGVMVVAMAESGPRRSVNMQLGAGLTLMRVGNIVAPPLFAALLVAAGSLFAWGAMATLLLVAAAGFIALGPGPAVERPAPAGESHTAEVTG
jgi:MFS family permease